jgi:EcsC protein family
MNQVTQSESAESVYEQRARNEMQRWRESMLRGPGMLGWASGKLQAKVNSFIPEKVHAAVTATIKQMTQGVLTGSEWVSSVPTVQGSLAMRERIAKQKIEAYRTTAAVEGGVTGAGGFMMSLADFPMLLGIKLKLLFDLANVYGYSTSQFPERLYVLQIFQLAFSSQQHRQKIFLEIDTWHLKRSSLPNSLEDFDWRTYQQEYRNYIDLAKLVQLIPVIGAPVGAIVNYKLIEQLGETAMNAYRLRWFQKLTAAAIPADIRQG